MGKYAEAGDHAIRCFDYYLQHSGSEDTDVLTRLGNLQARSYVHCLCVDGGEDVLCLDWIAVSAFVARLSVFSMQQ